MMKSTLIIFALILSGTLFAQQELNFYSFNVSDIKGNNFLLSQLKGKKVLVVNTASKCGFTPQYEDLEKLYKTYKDQNFVIIGFPANNFMRQEPGSNDEIAEFCQINYGVTFPMMSKISVKGNDIHPLYKWLTESTNSKIKWNFQKYMINKDGTIAGYVTSKVKPFDKQIIDWINGK